MVVLYGGFVCENACKRNLWGSNPRALAVWYRGVRRGGDTTQPLPLLLALLDHAPAVVGAAAPPHTELLRAFGTCN